MSYYVVLIQALYPPDPLRYAISTATNPQYALNSLHTYSPIACQLIHTIRADNRAEYLERTLHIKFRSKQLRGFWFRLDPQDVTFIQTLTDKNFFQIAGFLNRQAAPPPPPPKPVIAAEDMPDFLAKQLALCNKLLKT